jgi:hypothetical protein
MKYIEAFNIWNIPNELIKYIQPGQWVYAGDKDNKGIFLGVKKSKTIVVAWKGNINNQDNKREYIKALRQFSKG